MPAQELARGDEGERPGLGAGLAHQRIQELGPLKPPVAEQLGIVGGHHDGRAVERFAQALELRPPGGEEVARVLAGRVDGGGTIVDFLVGRAAGDAMVFQAGEAAVAGRGQVRGDVFQVQVKPDVAVEIAVARVAGVAGLAAPDLARALRIAAKRGDAFRGKDGRKHRVARARARVQKAVRVGDEPPEVRSLQDLLQGLDVSAFRQPDAPRLAAKAMLVMVARHPHLRPQGRRVIRQQRQQGVRGGAGDDFQVARFLELPEGPHQVAPVPGVKGLRGGKAFVIKPRHLLERLFPARALNLLFRQGNLLPEVALAAILQKRVLQHRAERGRQRQRQARGQPIPPPALQKPQQREIGFRDGLEQPVFLQELRVLRVPDERQVRMQDQGKVAGHKETPFRRRPAAVRPPAPFITVPPPAGTPVQRRPPRSRPGNRWRG